VELVEADVKAGLKLSPAVKEVMVIDRPIDDVRFIQYRAAIGGIVRCLGSLVVVFPLDCCIGQQSVELFAA